MNLYPAIDLLDGACVRLTKGRFDARVTYSDDPVSTARAFEAAGASFLHVVDLSGARRATDRQLPALTRILGATRLRVQVGGGLRTFDEATELVRLGADRVVIGSAAVRDPALVVRLLGELGPSRVTVALDVRVVGSDIERARVALHGWMEESPVTVDDAIAPLLAAGLERVLCTDIDRDGMLEGPNTELYVGMMDRYPGLDVQASGGIATLDDLRALVHAGVRSCVSGKALYEGAIDLTEALAVARAHGGEGARC